MSQSKSQIEKNEILRSFGPDFSDQSALRSELKWMRATNNLSINQYTFLVGNLIGEDTLYHAALLAQRWDVPVHQVLISLGWVSQSSYFQALAGYCGVEFLGSGEAHTLRPPHSLTRPEQFLDVTAMRRNKNGETRVVLAPTNAGPSSVEQAMSILGEERCRVAITTPSIFREAIIRRSGRYFIRAAIVNLRQIHPNMSAHSGFIPTQILLLAFLTFILSYFGTIDLKWTAIIMSGTLSIVFSAVTILKLIACYIALTRDRPSDQHARPDLIQDKDLPTYSVLVPLYREKEILPYLIDALTNLDYPAAKLEIKLILESCDKETIDAVRGLGLPGNIEIIIVPNIGPRTKPKALNYALQFISGKYVVIYDAEDRPEPDQLRKAVAQFQISPPECVCLQAKLNFYNGSENWLTRQFVVEYTAQFDGLLPALEQLRLPIPLGGTSNHFRREILEELGAWDPYKVTEDADLGIRLFRCGYTANILDSTTYEEACCRFKNWTLQRIRWLKGWMLTYAVHMRQPATLWRELGPRGFFGFQTIVGGLIASALIQPLFWALVIIGLLEGTLLGKPQALFGIPFWWLAILNFVLNYAISMMLAATALVNRDLKSYLRQIIYIPVYWTLISISAYMAFYKLIRSPFYWEKTEHGLSRYFNP